MAERVADTPTRDPAAILAGYILWLRRPHQFKRDPESTIGRMRCERCCHGPNFRPHNEWRAKAGST